MAKFSVLPIALTVTFTAPASAFAADDEICRAPLIYAATQSFEELDQVDQESYRYERNCGKKQSEGSNSADFFIDAVVEAVPLKAGGSAQSSNSSSEEWCNVNKSKARDQSFSFRVYRTVFEPALKSFDSCIAAKRSQLDVDLKLGSKNDFSVRMKNNNRNRVRFQGVKVTPDNAASCIVSYKAKHYSGKEVQVGFDFERDETITFDCERTLKTGSFYPEVSFNFRNNLQGYTYVMAEYDAKPIKKPIEPTKFLTPLIKGSTISATAHWDESGIYTKQCLAKAENMTFIGDSTKSTWHPDTVPYCLTRADFDGEEPCTAKNEWCEITTLVSTGCFVSNEWLAWYDDSIASKGLVRSIEQICAPQLRR